MLPTELKIHKATAKSIVAPLDGICLVSERDDKIVEAVRTRELQTPKNASEEVKYGGILFTPRE